MADEETATTAAGRRRTRGPEASARSAALERLKARLRGGRRSDDGGPQIRLENPIYDTVPEEEYNALVAKRREQAQSFIVDDDGLGYGDEGEEEDWSKAGFTLSSDESDGESERPKRKKVEKKDPQTKRTSSSSASLSAAATMMGANRLSSMFTSSVFKKSRDDKACDSIVDDVIAEFAPDETDRQRRRRVQLNSVPSESAASEVPRINNGFSDKSSIIEACTVAIGDAESIRVVKNNGCDLGLEKNCETDKENVLSIEDGKASIEQLQPNDCSSNGDLVEEKVVKDIELEAEPVAKKEVFTFNAKVKGEEENAALSATAGWQAVKSGGGDAIVANTKGASSHSGQHSEFNLEADGSLPFYILDAYEEFKGANTGTLYLFGKVISCF